MQIPYHMAGFSAASSSSDEEETKRHVDMNADLGRLDKIGGSITLTKKFGLMFSPTSVVTASPDLRHVINACLAA